ncbi:MAG: hypothetical protein ACLF0P_12735 [Thermoanaerobaculia bacterium]
MDRRTFLKASGTFLAVSAGFGVTSWLWRRSGSEDRVELPPELADLHDPVFAEAASRFEIGPLAAELHEIGVITGEGIDHEALARAMREDELVVYHGYYLAQTELRLYALAYLARQ